MKKRKAEQAAKTVKNEQKPEGIFGGPDFRRKAENRKRKLTDIDRKVI